MSGFPHHGTRKPVLCHSSIIPWLISLWFSFTQHFKAEGVLITHRTANVWLCIRRHKADKVSVLTEFTSSRRLSKVGSREGHQEERSMCTVM